MKLNPKIKSFVKLAKILDGGWGGKFFFVCTAQLLQKKNNLPDKGSSLWHELLSSSRASCSFEVSSYSAK